MNIMRKIMSPPSEQYNSINKTNALIETTGVLFGKQASLTTPYLPIFVF